MRRFLIGTPAHTGQLDVWYTNSLMATARMAIERGIYMREVFLSFDSIIQNARNDLVRIALEAKFDDLIFIDADQDWKPEWIFQLLDYPVDCVGAAVRKKTDQEENYNVKTLDLRTLKTDPATGLLTSPDMALGCGFIRFSRKALIALWNAAEKYTAYKNQTAPSAWIFDIRPVKGQLVGEDTHASDFLRTIGIQTWVDPAMTCGHIGPKRYTGDFAAWLAKAQADVAATDAKQAAAG